jgi:hypothetical protein
MEAVAIATLLVQLTAADYRLGKAYGLGRALADTCAAARGDDAQRRQALVHHVEPHQQAARTNQTPDLGQTQPAWLVVASAGGSARHPARARRRWRPPGGHRHRPRRQRPRAASGPEMRPPRPRSASDTEHRLTHDIEGEETCNEGHEQVRQERHRERQDVRGIHRRGTSCDEGARPGAEGGWPPRPARGQGGRGKRGTREDRRDAGTGSRHGRAAPCRHQSQRATR